MYDELVKRVRQVAEEVCEDYDVDPYNAEQRFFVIEEAADAIEELQKRVPKVPHGRLIDADAMEKECCHGCKNEFHKYENCIDCVLANAPTIIPAEEGEQ